MTEERVAWSEPVVGTDGALPPEGYRLRVGGGGVELTAADDAGAFYGRATLAQLRHLHADALPCGSIEDWPDNHVRGVMLDISRDKVPTMATLETLVDRLASWKINQLQLYIEHTFAYQDHAEVWRDASPLTAAEVHHLDRFCRDRHVELVPNQNCLGHMGRWLKHERYRPLAIAPEGWTERGRRRPPTTLDPAKPGSLALVRELLGELLPNFTSRRVHVGLDEPWELSAARLDEYGDWIETLRAVPELEGREMLVWGDILAQKPELLSRLPDGVTVCEWGYEDWHPFAARTEVLAGAGRPFWVCPGTSSWLTLLGRVPNMQGNCAAAAAAADNQGAAGYLTTDWGDLGHLQYLPVSEPGFAYAAAVSWCLESNRDIDLAEALDVHCFDDPARELAAATLRLGEAYKLVAASVPNMSVLVMHLYWPQIQLGRTFNEGMTAADLSTVEASLDDAAAGLSRARPRRADGHLVVEELETAATLVALLCRDGRARLASDGWLGSVPEATRHGLAAELEPLVESHRRLWLARNRPGGLPDSVAWLTHLGDCYRSGTTDRTWGGW